MTKGWLLFIAVLGLLLAFSVAVGSARASPGILYVKPSASGSGNCSNWANACTLQTALGVAGDGDEIWAAEGTHKPTSGTDRSATFQLVNGVQLYGGFVGTESSRDQRDWESNITLLSGDIDDNDITDANDVITTTANITGTNSYHVVTSSSVTDTCVLDGLTITGGYADGSYPDFYGGGMYNSSSSPTLANVTFSGNWAKYGGGMSNSSDSSPTLTDVTFSGNHAAIHGGGMYNHYSSPTLTDVTFSPNSADSSGGGMYNSHGSPTLADVTLSANSADYGGGMSNGYFSSPTLANVTFSGNSAEYSAGGMGNHISSSPTLANVTFSGNSAENGGGMSNSSNSSPTLASVSFTGNSASGNGGGMINGSNSSPTLVNVSFSGNSAENGAGMMNGGTPTLTNVTFSGNSASENGGGMSNWSGGSPTLTNVTFSGNSATYGGGIENYWSSPTLANCVLWGNTAFTATAIYSYGTGTPTISYSLVQGSGGSDGSWDASLGTDGGGNIDVDPQFVDANGPDNIVGTLDDNLRLWLTSPAIGAGDNLAVPADTLDLDLDSDITETLPLDLDGYSRILGGNVDMGPYEWPLSLTLTKTVINDDGGAAIAAHFQGYIQGTPVLWGIAQAVVSGTYTVSETAQTGYSASAWSGDCAPDGTITLAMGDDKTCSITNDDLAATLTLTKTVINNDGGTATIAGFQAYVDGSPVPWGIAQSVISGAHTVSETVHAGYSASAWSGDCAPGGTITLTLDDHATCSITNDDIAATLTLTKTLINDDGRTATMGDFQAHIQGTPVPWGVAQAVISGTYTVSETVLAGYSASAWSGDCAPDGTITLAIGEDKTCSITNDDMAPTVTLTKTVINDDDGTATLSDFQAYLDGDPVPWGVPQPVIPGTHTASESVLLGYVPSMWGGDCNEDGTITLNVGEDALCSITNDDTLHSYIPLVLKNYGS